MKSLNSKNLVVVPVVLASLVVIAAFAQGLSAEDAGADPELEKWQKAESQAKKPFAAFIATTNYQKMIAFPGEWKKQFSAEVCLHIANLCAENLYSKNPLKLDNKDTVIVKRLGQDQDRKPDDKAILLRQDIFFTGGRCAWALEKLLECELPPVLAETSSKELGEVYLIAQHKLIEMHLLTLDDSGIDLGKLSVEARLKLAEATTTNEGLLTKLSKDKEVSVRLAVAKNSKTPLIILSKLAANDPDTEVSAAANKNHNNARSFLGKKPSEEEVRLLRESEAAFQTLLETTDFQRMKEFPIKWKKDLPELGRFNVAVFCERNLTSKKPLPLENQDLAIPHRHDLFITGGRCSWALEWLLDCELPPVVASTTGKELEATRSLVYDKLVYKNFEVRDTSGIDLEKLSVEERRKLAEAPTTPDGLLTKLSKDKEVSVRLAVANNSHTPQLILARFMTKDPDAEVRATAEKKVHRSGALLK